MIFFCTAALCRSAITRKVPATSASCAIYLESAVFMLHISRETSGIHRVIAGRVFFSSSMGFWLAPFQLTKTDAPNTRVSKDTSPALGRPAGALTVFTWKEPHF
jgi:hypothetical protein